MPDRNRHAERLRPAADSSAARRLTRCSPHFARCGYSGIRRVFGTVRGVHPIHQDTHAEHWNRTTRGNLEAFPQRESSPGRSDEESHHAASPGHRGAEASGYATRTSGHAAFAQGPRRVSGRRRSGSTATRVRFVAKGLRSQRSRLGLSAADFGKLLGVSAQSVYNWEHDVARPRAEQLSKLAALRTIGKREAGQRLKQSVAAKGKTRRKG